MFYFFFFQAEDGIRDVAVTGVQTCALPISPDCPEGMSNAITREEQEFNGRYSRASGAILEAVYHALDPNNQQNFGDAPRSEERRVGKECRSRWSPYH